jgi:putative membrane protein
MILDALLAYLHYTAILILASALGAEALLLRAQAGAATLRSLARADILYGVSSGIVVLTGLLRLFFGAKGATFYTGNPVFWTKVGLFIVVGLLSLPPTLKFIRWRRSLDADPAFAPAPGELSAVRRLVFIELHLLALIPLAAVFMARGLGF